MSVEALRVLLYDGNVLLSGNHFVGVVVVVAILPVVVVKVPSN